MALALSVSLYSCHNLTDIGLGLGTDGNLQAIYTDTVSVSYSTVLSDSAVNGNSIYLLSGNITDPVFGPVEAVAYFQPSLLPQYSSSTGNILTDDNGMVLYDTLSLTSPHVVDSLKLRLYFDGSRVYGDTSAISKFYIHRLSSIMHTSSYNGDEKQAYDPQPLAEFELNTARLKDSAGNRIAHFVSLPKTLTQELINDAAEAKGNNITFLNKFRGLAIVPDKSNKAVYGFSTGSLDLNGYNSSLLSYWHTEGDTTAQLYVFNINGPRYSSLTFDRSKTALASLTKDKNELPMNSSADRLYLQGGSGISTKIDLSALRHLGANLKVAGPYWNSELDPSSVNNLYRKTYYMTLAEADARQPAERKALQAS
ncbi:MAG: DUF4270 domain-containing protein [Leadbetterella sp.]|nr:DUF4270 domain-containing protein [Leadbetterella sp.]